MPSYGNRRRLSRVVANRDTVTVSGKAKRHGKNADLVAIESIVTLDDLHQALRRNQITELRVGWKDSDFLQSFRAIKILERGLSVNTSVTSVSIGWRFRNKNVLIRLLRALTRHGETLKHLQIVFQHHTWLPEHILRNLLAQQTKLESIDFHNMCVLRKVSPVPGTACQFCCSENDAWLEVDKIGNCVADTVTGKSGKKRCDGRHCVISRVLIHLHNHQELKSIQLVDCFISDDEARRLADFLHIRGGIAKLSLRGNARFLGAAGLKAICQAPIMDRLDLSLCNLGTEDAIIVAKSVAKRPWPLQELLLCGNYRIDLPGLLALTKQSCCNKLNGLNISFCDIGQSKACHVMKSLQELDRSTPLRQISMQGIPVGDEHVAEAIGELLKQNTSLRVVKLNYPGNFVAVASPELAFVLEGMRHNYEVEELRLVDSRPLCDVEYKLRKDIDFFVKLNRAGRRVFLQKAPASLGSGAPASSKPTNSDSEWLEVLEKAGEDLDVLFWIVKKGAERFHRSGRVNY